MSTTYGFKKRETRLMAGFKYTLAILMGMLRSSLGAAWSMARVWLEYGYTLLTGQRQTCEARNKRGKYSQCGNVLFPVWECFIPNVGIKFSLNPHILRSLLFLMLVLGGKAWGQDYSGTYYIASGGLGQKNNTGAADTKYTYDPSTPSNNFYLCPTEGWCYYKPDNDFSNDGTTYPNPFLTTYKCRSTAYHDNDASDAVWIIKKAPDSDYYYIIQKSTGRYLVSNGVIRTTSGGQDRIRVHLEAVAESNLDKALFSIDYDNICWRISPKDLTDGSYYTSHSDHSNHKYLVVNFGNYNYLDGRSDKTGGPTDYTNTAGTIGIYTQNDANSPFYLEDYIKRPTISYNSDNKVVITAQTGATVKYTLDGTTPSVDNGTVYDTPLEPDLGTTIKAVAIIGEDVSNIATFTYIKLTDSYVIQSKDCEFYNLVPNLKIGDTDYPKNLTTLNVPCKTMVWDFENAADNDGQYYYIHNSQGGYMYYTATSNSAKYVYFNADKDTNDNGYKFSITPYTGTGGGYNIIPKGQTAPINKSSITANGNAKLTAVKLAGAVGDATSRWALIPYSNETKRTCLPQWRGDAPFAESDDEHTYYYRINSVSKTNMPLILDNDGDIKSTTLPTSGYDNRKSVWVIKKVGTDTDGLLDYYTFQNAYTGEFLYLNKLEKEVKDDSSPGMLQMGQPTVDGADATWSHFVIVQTLNGYNIIPRVLVDNTKATGTETTTHESFNCINRANGSVYTGTWYDNDGGSRWTFEQKTDVKCMNPTYAEDTEGNFTISCVTNAAVIHYTTNGEEPTASSGVYSASAPIESASEKICIKAIAIVGNGADDYSKSNIITLMNKPDITLKEGTEVVDENTYIYDGTAKEPAVTISIGNVVAPTDTYTTGYANNTDAGTETSIPTATITYVDNDLWIIKPNTASKTFVINPRELTLTWTNTELVYNGTAQAPTATATGTVNDDAIAVTVTGTQTNAGEYTATASTLTGDKAGNYKLPIANTQTFTISPKSLGDGETAAEGITLDITTEGGNVVLNSVKDGEKTLVNNTDYTYDIQDEASDKIIAIAGIGNYTGSISGVYVCPVFTDPDGAGAGPSAAVYQARRDFASPTGVNAYIVRSVNPTIGTLTISKLEYIPKDVPVLLLTESQASGFLAAEKDESTPAVSVGTVNSNLLKVAPTEGVPVKTAEVYMFYLGEFVLTQAGTVNAGRFYVHNPNFTDTPNAPAPAPARRSLMIVKEETTGIADLPQTENKFADDAWYTMDGRRLNGKPAKAGLYIHQGQKRVIK